MHLKGNILIIKVNITYKNSAFTPRENWFNSRMLAGSWKDKHT